MLCGGCRGSGDSACQRDSEASRGSLGDTSFPSSIPLGPGASVLCWLPMRTVLADAAVYRIPAGSLETYNTLYFCKQGSLSEFGASFSLRIRTWVLAQPSGRRGGRGCGTGVLALPLVAALTAPGQNTQRRGQWCCHLSPWAPSTSLYLQAVSRLSRPRLSSRVQ